MNNNVLDTLLQLQQVERHHQQRLDILWSQFKDAWTVIQSLELGLLGFALAFPGLTVGSREALAFVIVTLPIAMGLFSRTRMERAAAQIAADYSVEYSLVTGINPPRPLYSRALKLGRNLEAPGSGVPLVPPSAG